MEKSAEKCENSELTKLKNSQAIELQQLIGRVENEIKKSEENVKFYKDTIKDYKIKLSRVQRQKFNAIQLFRNNGDKFQDYLQDVSVASTEIKPDLANEPLQIKNLNATIDQLKSQISDNNAVIEDLCKMKEN